MTLSVSELAASYGAGPVLENVSLTIEEGVIYGLVGPNGHGKTSLLRAISGMMPQQSGAVSFRGRSFRGVNPETIAASGIAHVPQGDLVYKNMTILENLQVGGYTNTSAAVTRRQLRKVFDLFPKLEERAGQIASSLSGGERRMLGIGRGLMMAEARLLMLDEPSLGLAPVVIDQIYMAIEALHRTGLTILVVEENVGRISAIADRISLVNHGRLAWSGPAGELVDNPALLEVYLGA